MEDTESSCDCLDSAQLWTWVGIGAGVALGAAGVIYLLLRTNGPRRMEKLLRRCEDRILSIESSLSDLESSFGSSPA